MIVPENKSLVRRFFDEMCNGRQLELADDLFAASYTHHGPVSLPPAGPGPEGIRQEVADILHAFSDARWTVHEMRDAEADAVVVRWTGEGTHTGDLNGLPPSGRHIQIPGLLLFRIERGKIVEGWDLWDVLGLLQQVGALPSMPAA